MQQQMSSFILNYVIILLEFVCTKRGILQMDKKNCNRYTFGLGTVGRDMVYTLVSMYLMFYLTDILCIDTNVLWWVTAIMLGARIFDAFNDPVMGVIVDNTHTRWGKFKPWIVPGILLSGLFTILLFTDFELSGSSYVLYFAVCYLLWGITYTMHDISYWSMLPSLSKNQKERERIGSVARICANIGLFLVVSLIVPVTEALGARANSIQKGYFVLAVILVLLMILFQCFTVFGVREPDESIHRTIESTSLKDMVKIIFQNDQLLVTAISMSLFMIGYMTTTSFGLYYFKYAYGDESMYSIFAIILGVSQITALSVFPIFSKHFSRRTLYSASTLLVVVGYLIFFFAPTTTMLFIGISGILIFVGQAFIQLIMLMFLTDTVEYGEWKFHKRNDSVTLSLQPFINKLGGAVASGITGSIVIVSGMKTAESAADMTAGGLLILKCAMLIFPLLCILIGFLIYRSKYILDETMYQNIVTELATRKQTTNVNKEED